MCVVSSHSEGVFSSCIDSRCLNMSEQCLEVSILSNDVSAVPFQVVRVDHCSSSGGACKGRPVDLNLSLTSQRASGDCGHLGGLNLDDSSC